jgi:hypothetical protein
MLSYRKNSPGIWAAGYGGIEQEKRKRNATRTQTFKIIRGI